MNEKGKEREIGQQIGLKESGKKLKMKNGKDLKSRM